MTSLLYPDLLTVVKMNGRRINKAYFFKLRKFQTEIPQQTVYRTEVQFSLTGRNTLHETITSNQST